MNDREAFEAWTSEAGYSKGETDDDFDYPLGRALWRAWQAAAAATQEQCAKACDAIAEDKWALYKGRPPYTGKEPGRASDYVQGQSDGADQCADAIRKGWL